MTKEKIQVKESDLHENCMVPEKVIRPGDELVVFCDEFHPRFSFYVKAKVEEVFYIWTTCDRSHLGLQHCSTLHGDYLSISTGRVSSLGWDITRTLTAEEFERFRKDKDLRIINQEPWVDWPIGYAAYIGDDGFFTLEEAREAYGRFSKKKLGRRMRQYLRRKTTGPRMPHWSRWMRKGYV